MTYKTIILRRGKEESLKRYHPWIFSGAIVRLPEMLTEGETVRVESHDGRYLATGHYQVGSISVRVLSFRDVEIDSTFWQQKISAALTLRRTLQLTRDTNPDNEMFRLVHGEGDGLPGLIVDVYGETAVIQAHSVGMHLNRSAIADAILNVPEGNITTIYYKSESTLPYKADLREKEGYLTDTTNAPNIAKENGLRFHIDWLQGQKTGFFVDQRENRLLLERYSHGRHVLNMCCYTGGFSVYALRGGAKAVCSVDSSAKAIQLTEENVALNFPEDRRHEGVVAEAFQFLRQTKHGSYDLIVLDPPAFAKRQSALHNALKGYTRLNAAALEVLPPGGILFTFSCSQAVSAMQFRLAVLTAAAQAGRSVRILHQLHQPADHPVSIYHPEGEYLKGLVLAVE